MRALFAWRDARIYLVGQALSSFGDTVMWLAMGIWVKTLTGSNGAAGLVFFCFAFPQLFAPLTGLLVDRVRRRPLLITTNLVTATVMLVLLGVHDRGEVGLIYAVMVLYGVGYSVLTAGQSGLLKDLLPEHLLGDANSFLRTVQEGFRLFGPLVGAGLFAAFGGATVALVDAATFVGAAIALATLRVREQLHPREAEPWRQRVTAGIRHIARTRPLRQMITACAIACLVIGFIESAIFAVVAALHRPPTFIAVLTVAQGVGAVGAGLTAPRIMRRWGETRLTALGLTLFAASTALLAVPQLAVAVVATSVLGASLPWLVIGPMTLLQRLTPGRLMGRVSSAADMLTGTPQTLSIAVGAALVTVVSYQLLLLAITVITGVTAAYLVGTQRAQRRPAQPVGGSIDRQRAAEERRDRPQRQQA